MRERETQIHTRTNRHACTLVDVHLFVPDACTLMYTLYTCLYLMPVPRYSSSGPAVYGEDDDFGCTPGDQLIELDVCITPEQAKQFEPLPQEMS